MRVGYVSCAVLPEPDPDAQMLLEASRRAGLSAEFVPWDEAGIEPADFDLLVLRSCWNYHYEPQRFSEWLSQTEGQVHLLNPPELVRWNMDKRYLQDLEGAGIPVVPTAFVQNGTSPPLAELSADRGWSKVIVKPTVSAGSWKTRVFNVRDHEADAFLNEVTIDRGAMVQPFLSSVQTTGERSIMAVNGRATHVVVKKPRFDGDDESVTLGNPVSEHERSLLEKVLSTLPQQPLYARLDLIQDDEGQWLVSELELIEPSLFFLQCPAAADEFAQAVARSLTSLRA